jgi:hypothetical protein
LGWWLGTQVSLDMLFEQVERYNGYLSKGGLAIAVICIAVIVYNAFKTQKSSKNSNKQ